MGLIATTSKDGEGAMNFMSTKYVFIILFVLTVLMLYAAQLLVHSAA